MSKVGRLRFELRTNRLKAECSTAELATPTGCAYCTQGHYHSAIQASENCIHRL